MIARLIARLSAPFAPARRARPDSARVFAEFAAALARLAEIPRGGADAPAAALREKR